MVMNELLPLALMVPQLLLPVSGMNWTGFTAVPSTSIVPPACAVMERPLLIRTTTPASTVSVTPLATVTFPMTEYGLCAAVQAVLLEIVPLTFVVAAWDGAAKIEVISRESPMASLRDK